ncbi:MAG: helix-turn-helix domain-containing protein [Solirubrobacteraceae bacterium]
MSPADANDSAPPDDTPLEGELSQRLRALREQKGMTLRAVADAAGISVSFLSQVETGKASPSIATLIRMARSLDENVAALFEPRSSSHLIRAGDRPRLVHPQRKWTEQLLSPRDFRHLQVIISTVSPGASSGEEAFGYEAAETCALVQSGKVSFWLESERFDLEVGDCLAFDSRQPHRVENVGKVPAEILWASSPPAY